MGKESHIEHRTRSEMTSVKITLLPLAICLLLSQMPKVSGKPSPKHFLIETKEKAKNSDSAYEEAYDTNINIHNRNVGSIRENNFNQDYGSMMQAGKTAVYTEDNGNVHVYQKP